MDCWGWDPIPVLLCLYFDFGDALLRVDECLFLWPLHQDSHICKKCGRGSKVLELQPELLS